MVEMDEVDIWCEQLMGVKWQNVLQFFIVQDIMDQCCIVGEDWMCLCDLVGQLGGDMNKFVQFLCGLGLVGLMLQVDMLEKGYLDCQKIEVEVGEKKVKIIKEQGGVLDDVMKCYCGVFDFIDMLEGVVCWLQVQYVDLVLGEYVS